MAIEKVDLVIVGAGPAGLAAAAEVSRHNGNVIVLDESPRPGGRLPSQMHREPRSAGHGSLSWSNGAAKAETLVNEAQNAGARIHCGVAAWGIFPDWYVGIAPTDASRPMRDCPAGFETRAVLVAAGACQNPLILPGWTLPGVITAGAAQTMINVHRVLPGHKAVIIGIDPLCLAVAQLLIAVGAEVLGVFLPPANGLQSGPTSPKAAIRTLAGFSAYAPGFLMTLAAKAGKYMSTLAAAGFPRRGIKIDGLPLMLRQAALSISGLERAQAVKTAALSSDGCLKSGSEIQLQTDIVITSSGLSPLAELAHLAGCPLHHIPEMGGWVPVHNDRFETPRPGIFIAGSISGVEGAAVAEIQGRIAGLAAASYLKLAAEEDLERNRRRHQKNIIEARQTAIPFYPQIETGRARMNRIWQELSG
ncbi:Sarcosine oxidase alpha subunit (EC [Olavius sp. associated proteobacterium Delta 1]|nr:Sarcosine oxidase alpha subunit (EC [Olavius sp. associated proteobacterium Delta 1]